MGDSDLRLPGVCNGSGAHGVVAIMLGHWTCDLQVAGSSPPSALLHSGLGQATYIYVPLSPSSTV